MGAAPGAPLGGAVGIRLLGAVRNRSSPTCAFQRGSNTCSAKYACDYVFDRHTTVAVDTRCVTQPSPRSTQPRGLAAAVSLTLS